jgi:hypothetical protein
MIGHRFKVLILLICLVLMPPIFAANSEEEAMLEIAKAFSKCSALYDSFGDKVHLVLPDKSTYVKDVGNGFEIVAIYLFQRANYDGEEYFAALFYTHKSRFDAIDMDHQEMKTGLAECQVWGELQAEMLGELRERAYKK